MRMLRAVLPLALLLAIAGSAFADAGPPPVEDHGQQVVDVPTIVMHDAIVERAEVSNVFTFEYNYVSADITSSIAVPSDGRVPEVAHSRQSSGCGSCWTWSPRAQRTYAGWPLNGYVLGTPR